MSYRARPGRRAARASTERRPYRLGGARGTGCVVARATTGGCPCRVAQWRHVGGGGSLCPLVCRGALVVGAAIVRWRWTEGTFRGAWGRRMAKPHAMRARLDMALWPCLESGRCLGTQNPPCWGRRQIRNRYRAISLATGRSTTGDRDHNQANREWSGVGAPGFFLAPHGSCRLAPARPTT
jgi:hypothetical protein